MKRFIEGEDRSQSTLFPEHLDDYIGEDNPVRVIDVFVDELDLKALGFEGMQPEMTGRPEYHPASLLKIYIYGYLNRVQSSRRLERETQRNCVPMPCRPNSHPAFHQHRARINARQVLVFSLSTMRDQSEMYDRRLSAHCTVGA